MKRLICLSILVCCLGLRAEEVRAAPDTYPYQLARPTKRGLQWPIVKSGSRGFVVRALQQLLNARGYRVSVDGRFAAQTKSVVQRFQRAKGLSVDGLVGGQTWEVLVPTLRRGTRGPAVRTVQELLRVQGRKVQVDGYFGRQTAVQIKKFPHGVGILPDSEVKTTTIGPASWCYLLGGRYDGE
jgi:peptidoglycan hydrolase-like protein with peptidoglycan-binding domain